MIAKVTRGSDVRHLVRYLLGETRSSEAANVHADPRVIVADAAVGVPLDRALSQEERRAAERTMDAPSALYGTVVAGGNVWHVSLSTKSGVDRELADAEWAAIAMEVVERLGFTAGEGRAPCRWLAVRHGRSAAGNDHMHLAVNLVREDATAASTWNDFKVLSALCRDMEVRHGLTVVEGRSRGGMPGISRADMERSVRAGRAEPKRVELARRVRAAATAAGSEDEFVRRLRAGGLIARPRYERGGKRQVVGYSVSLRPADRSERPVWFGGASLGKDLRLSDLRAGWDQHDEARAAAVREWGSRSGRGHEPGPETARWAPRAWQQAAEQLGAVTRELRAVPVEDRAAWEATAQQAAGIVGGLSARLEPVPGPLAAAAEVLARSAQAPQGRSRPVVVRRSGTLRTVAAVMAQAQITEEAALAWQLLLSELLRLAQAIHDAHVARGEATQAARLAEGARVALARAKVDYGEFRRVAERIPELVAVVDGGEDREVDERRRPRQSRPSGAVRPEEWAALAGRREPRLEPAWERDR